jgi:hypothetical protein
MKNVRLVHYYLGVFFAPTIVFFAFSGVLQVFKLHESYRDTPGAQGDWIAWMAQVHKEQSLAPPPVAPPRKAEGSRAAREPQKSKPPALMRWFTAAMGASLGLTTLLGLYIAFLYPRRRMGFSTALVVGLIAPIVLLQMG